MSNKRRLIVIIVGIALVIATICIAPWPTRIDVELEAFKYDANGNQIGTSTIYVKGTKLEYLFRMDRLQISINSFDGHRNIELANFTNGTSEITGAILKKGNFYKTSVHGWYTPTNELFFGDLGFSDNMDRWIFCNHTEEGGLYYIASINNTYSNEELLDYFSLLFPATH